MRREKNLDPDCISFPADIRITNEGFETANDINTRAPPLRDKWLNLVDDL